MFNLGYDFLSIDGQYIFVFFRFIQKEKIKISHLKHQDDMYTFYVPTYQRYKLYRFKYPIIYLSTYGLMKYIFLLSHHYLNVIGVICFLFSIFISSYCIYDIRVIGTIPTVNDEMEMTLNDLDVSRFSFLKSYQRLNDILDSMKESYQDDVEYMNVYQVGSVFYVEYTKKKQEQLEKEDYRNLYAYKDGLIESFDIDSGLIRVKKNDYVKKGDLLVENTIISTQNQTQIIPVKGSVYAYTFNQYEASIENHGQDQGEAFYQLLLNIRSRLPAHVKIDKENVLQFKKTRSKIFLRMHYTFIENIAIKGESHEGSH